MLEVLSQSPGSVDVTTFPSAQSPGSVDFSTLDRAVVDGTENTGEVHELYATYLSLLWLVMLQEF